MRIALLTWESLHTIAVGGVAPHVTELAAGVARVCVLCECVLYRERECIVCVREPTERERECVCSV